MPAPLKARKAILLTKIEASYGVDAVPTGAANAMLVANLNVTPFESSPIERNNVQPYLGSRQQIHTGVHGVMEFDIEVASAGGAGTAPKYGPQLRGCGHAETINVGVDVQYDPTSENEESTSDYFFNDGQKHPYLGCRGSMELRLVTKQIPYFNFRKMGIYVPPSSVADPVPTLAGFQVPKSVGRVNTPTFELHGFAGKMHTFTLTQGNDVAHRELVVDESIQITDRRSVGQIILEAPPLATKDFLATAKAETLGALQIIHGVGAGNIVQVDAANVQIIRPRYQEMDGITMLAMGLVFVPSSAGDDEYKITVK